MRLDWSRVQKQQQIFDNTCTCVYSPLVVTATALELTTVTVIPGIGRNKGLFCFKTAVHCDLSHSTPHLQSRENCRLATVASTYSFTISSSICILQKPKLQNTCSHTPQFSNPSASLYQICFFVTYQLVYCLIFFFPQEIIILGGQHSYGYCSWLSLGREIQIPRGKVPQPG